MGSFIELPYNRAEAVAYAHQWAYFRNPDYFDFQGNYGDSTNFASQCLLEGSGRMNYGSILGWYYISQNQYAASWTRPDAFYRFLAANDGEGPYGYAADPQGVFSGDYVQLAFEGREFVHTMVVVMICGKPIPEHIFVAAHSSDADCRPLSSYTYTAVRYVHIEGVRERLPL